MFCSKCGKTLKPESGACTFCGAPVGDSRFEGSGYTAVQQRFVSGAADDVREATPYTRTTYTSMEDGEAQQGDIYSRTTYRPILKDEEPAPDPARAEPSAGQDEPDAQGSKEPESSVATASAPTPPKAAQPVLHVTNLAEDEPDSSIVIAPLKPIKKTGISPEVQQYIRRMNEQKAQKRGKGLFAGGTDTGEQPGTQADEILDMLAAEARADGQTDTGDRDDAQAATSRRARSDRKSLPRFVKPAVTVACILVILSVAAYALIMQFANASPIEGVGYDLHRNGIALIKTRVTETYRLEMIKVFREDSTMQKFLDTVDEKHAEIAALMPENPMKNDQLFIDTLDAIQEAVDNANSIDAVARLSGDTSLTALGEESQAAWKEIENSIKRLEEAKYADELTGIMQGAELQVTTPEPTEAPPEVKYKTLKRGMKSNKNVKNLQLRLKELGWFNSSTDGSFGQVTELSVKKFQNAAGLEVTGIADAETQVALYADDAPRSSKKATPKPESSPTLLTPAPEQPQVTQPPVPDAEEPPAS